MQTFFHKIQSIDRRWVYLILIVTLIVSLIIKRPINPVVLQPVQQLYDAVNDAPAGPGEGKIILVGITFSPSTLGESGNQARALIRHLMLQRKRFAIISVGEFQGALIGSALVKEIADFYKYEYGVDWISFGFQPNTLAFYTSFPRDIQGAIKTDGIQQKPLREFQIMQGIDKVEDDIALLVEVTASASAFNWIADVQGRYPLKIGYACTGIMTAEAYPFLDSGQLTGMMPGLKGAADYEKLVDDLEQNAVQTRAIEKPFNPKAMSAIAISPARELMFTQGAAHIVIILFIILGNIGLIATRRRARTTRKEDA